MSATEPEVCITCSDEGRLGEVVRPAGTTCVVRTARGEEEVDTTLVGPLAAGDQVLVHAGVAITALAPGASAHRTASCG